MTWRVLFCGADGGRQQATRSGQAVRAERVGRRGDDAPRLLEHAVLGERFEPLESGGVLRRGEVLRRRQHSERDRHRSHTRETRDVTMTYSPVPSMSHRDAGFEGGAASMRKMPALL